MNKEWSELNKLMQLQLKKAATFQSGIKTLMELRSKLMLQVSQFKKELSKDDLCAMPYPNAKGYHSKTIAYSLWHIFRIEDIVVHSLIKGDAQIFFAHNYQGRINSPIITTGNELIGESIADFSKDICIEELYNYITDVYSSTEKILKALSFSDMSVTVNDEKRRALESLNVVSQDENAYWLIDYWCSKNVRGLIQMPLSRHHIMHIEACLRIKEKLKTQEVI